MGTQPRTISKAEALAEAYKRGLLPPDKKAAYEEAQRRGLVGAPAQSPAPQAAGPAIPASGMGAMGSRAPGDVAAYQGTIPQIKPQTTNPNAPGYFDPLAPAVPNNQNPKSPDFQFNWQRDYPQAEPTPEIQLPAVPEGWTADEWYMDRAAGIERRNAEALRATSNPVVDLVRAGDKALMDAGGRLAYKLDPQGKVPQFISENVTPAAQKLMGGLASKLPYGETMGPMGEAIGGGLSEFAATTARNPVQGMSEATDMLEPTHYIARGANSLGEAGSQALAGNWDAARQAYMEATPDLLIGTVGVVPFGSATVAGMQRAVQAPRAALRAEAQRALGAADDLPTMPPGAAQTATQAQPSPAPVTPQAVAPPAAQAGPQFFDPKGDPLDVKIVARSETGSYVVQTKDGREVIVGFDGVLPQSARSPDYVPETMDFGGRKISDLSDEELAALKQRAEEKIKVMKTEGQEQSIPSMLGERNAATYEQKRRAAQAASSSTQPTVPQAPRGGVQTATQAPPVQAAGQPPIQPPANVAAQAGPPPQVPPPGTLTPVVPGNGVAVDSFNALPVKTREGMLRALSASGMSRDQAFAAIRSLNDLPPERANMFEAELIRRYGGPDQFPNLKTNLTAMGSDFSMQVPGKGGDPQGVMNRSLLEQAKSEGEYLERMAEQIFGPGKVATKADLEQYSEVLGGRYRKLLSEQYPGVGRMRGQNRLAEQQRIDGARSQLADYLKRPDVMANVPTWVQDEVMLRVSDDLRRMKFTPEEQAIILQGNPELAPLFTPDRDLIYSPKLWATIVDLYPTQVGHSLQSAYRIAIDSALKGTDAAQRTVAKRLMRMRGQSKVRANAANPDKRGFGLLNLLEDAVPGYKALRQEFGDVAGATTAADMPNKFFRVAKDEEALDDFITVYNDELTPLQQEAVRNGITTQIRQALRNKTEFTDLTELDMPAMRGLPNITQITSQPFLEALPKVFGADGQRMVDAIRLSRANIGNIASINDAFKSGTPKGMAIQKNGRNIYENPSATDANPIDAATSTLAGVGGLAAMTGSLQVAAPVLGGAALRGLYRMYKRGKSLTPGQKAALAEWLFKPRRATDALPPSTPRRFSKVGYAGNVATGAAVGATAGAFQGDPTTGALVGALGGATRAKLRSMRANRSIIPTAPPPPRPRNPLNPFSARAAQAAVQGGQAPRALPGQTSNASATVTGALVGGGIGAAANPDDPGKGAVYGALAGGALTGGARKLLGNSLKTGAPRKGPPGSPARVKRIEDMVAVGDKGVVDVARSMPKADVLAAASKIASEGVPGGVKITNVDEAVQIIEDAANFRSFASDVTRTDQGLAPYPELRTAMKSGAGQVVPFSGKPKPPPAPKGGAKPPVAPPPPFKPVEGAEVIDTSAMTPAEISGMQKELNALMQERRTASGARLAEIDRDITSIRNALEMDGGNPAFNDVPVTSRFNAPVDIPWKKGSPESLAIEKAIADKRWKIEAVPLSKVIPTQDSVFYDYAKAANRYAGDERYPLVVKQGDQYFVADGHHRMMAQQGGDQVRARVVDLSPAPPKPPAQAGFGGNRSLPMDEASRMQRAREMGFDVDTPLYHGTGAKFDAFDADKGGGARAETGVWLTSSPERASGYAPRIDRRTGEGGQVMPVYIRGSNILDIDARGANWNRLGDKEIGHLDLPDAVDDGYDTNDIARWARQQGYDGVRFRNVRDRGMYADNYETNLADTVVVFDPQNIRGKFAAFDPSQEGSSKLLAGFGRELGAGGAAGVATAVAGPRDINGDGVIDEQERASHSMSVLSNAAIAGGVTRFARTALGKSRGVKPPPGPKPPASMGFGGGKGPPKPSIIPGVTPPPKRRPPVGLAAGAAGAIAGAAMPADDPQERALNALLMASGAAAAGKAVQRGMTLPKRGDIVLSKPMAREIETTRRGLAANEVASIRGNAASPNPQSIMDAAGTPRAVAASMQRQGKGNALTERYNALGEPGKARAAAEVERTKKVRQVYQNQINAEIEARGGFDGWKRWLKESSEDFAALKRQARSWPNTGNKPRNQQWPQNLTNKGRRQRQLDRMERIAEESVPTLPDISDILRENNRQRKVIRDVLKNVPEARTLSDADLDSLVTLYMDKKAADVTSRILEGNYRVKPGSEEYWLIAGLAALGVGATGAAGYNSLAGQGREQSPR